jgi:hypothetical protein
MKTETLRHHVLLGMRLFVKDRPDSAFQKGLLHALEQILQILDHVHVPNDVFYAGNASGQVGLSEDEVQKLLTVGGFDEQRSLEWSKMRHGSEGSGHAETIVEVRDFVRSQLNSRDDDPSDTDYIFGWRAACEEVQRVMNYMPSRRLQYKVSHVLSIKSAP